MHLLFKHKEKFEPYLGIFSDEHGERLHKEVQVIEKRFGHCLNKEILADCIWSLNVTPTSINVQELCFELIFYV